jgi:hypothetical protein
VWSAEKRAEGLEYMQPKPSSHSGRIVGNPEVTQKPRSALLKDYTVRQVNNCDQQERTGKSMQQANRMVWPIHFVADEFEPL